MYYRNGMNKLHTIYNIPQKRWFAMIQRKILICGSNCDMGIALKSELNIKYGLPNVFLTDFHQLPLYRNQNKYFQVLPTHSKSKMYNVILKYKINTIINLKQFSYDNLRSDEDALNYFKYLRRYYEKLLQLADKCNLCILGVGSVDSICGMNTRKAQPQTPATLKGTLEAYEQILGYAYYKEYGTDFRYLRFPPVLFPWPSTALHDPHKWITHMLFAHLDKKPYEVPFYRHARQFYITFKSAISAICTLLDTPNNPEKLIDRIYDSGGVYATIEEYAHRLNKIFPGMYYDHSLNQIQIANNWIPNQVVRGTAAVKQFGWKIKSNKPKTLLADYFEYCVEREYKQDHK